MDGNYELQSIYQLKWGFLWIDLNNKLIIVRCPDYQIVDSLVHTITASFQSSFWKFQLEKGVIDKIFDRKDMIKSALITDPITDPNLFRTLIIKDTEFYRKAEDPRFEFIFDYDRASSTYSTSIRGFDGPIRVGVMQSGKIALFGRSIKLDRCREWLIELLIRILKIRNDIIKAGDLTTSFLTTDFIHRTELNKNLNAKRATSQIVPLLEKIIVLKNNPNLDSVEFPFPLEIAYLFDKFLNPIADLICPDENCNAQMFCNFEKCNSTRFEIKKEFASQRYHQFSTNRQKP